MTGLTQAELDVISQVVGGRSPGSIAEGRGLTEKTISSQPRIGCHRLGFRNRREVRLGHGGYGSQFRPAGGLLSPGNRMT